MPALLLAMAAAWATAAEPDHKMAGWQALQPKLTPQQVAAVLEPAEGRPLIVTRTKNGRYETWNYDNGGNVAFVGGLLEYWTAPKAGKLSGKTAPATQPADAAPHVSAGSR